MVEFASCTPADALVLFSSYFIDTGLVPTHQTDRHPFNGVFQDNLGKPAPQRLNQNWILIKQEMMGWQWHQLDHVQIICTSLQSDNHASISSSYHSIFHRPDALPDAQPTVSKH